jgi:hypothetical protein
VGASLSRAACIMRLHVDRFEMAGDKDLSQYNGRRAWDCATIIFLHCCRELHANAVPRIIVGSEVWQKSLGGDLTAPQAVKYNVHCVHRVRCTWGRNQTKPNTQIAHRPKVPIRGINNMEWLNRKNEFSDQDLKLLQFHPEHLARCAIETIRLQKGENVSVPASNWLPLFVATDVRTRGYQSLIPNLTEPKRNFGAG